MEPAVADVASPDRARSRWRGVAVPHEHGGWGLTAEPALLGLLLAWSGAGVAIAVAAVLAFLVRTPLKVVLVDRRRGRSLPRTRHAAIVAGGELVVLVAAVGVALATAGAEWLLPWVAVLPLFVVELWYDARSRGRRLVPELCGGVGMTACVAAIVVAGDGGTTLALAAWAVLAARAVASIAFARVQVTRVRSDPSPRSVSDLGQATGVMLATVAWAIDRDLLLGAVAVLVVVVAQLVWSRGPARPAKLVGIWQMVFGLLVVAGAAAGVGLA